MSGLAQLQEVSKDPKGGCSLLELRSLGCIERGAVQDDARIHRLLWSPPPPQLEG
ncbi:hypothetical protein JRQ81_007973 [Phrynocephalus forsythii]|uniref:Uncharacterized protein n=1 Tax=Phrynocephalus forsythii TaxID=171643 RepID=A0A9Q0XDG3_9SAUR|nr:hypothetical protein JRQ81_007973 [Phrynocephalus forsythii]